MVVNGNFLKLYNMMGNCRNLLSSRIILPTYQPIATIKKTVEEKLGLPPKPKRPKTNYFRFMEQTRPLLRKKYPDVKMTELTKLLAQEWNKADAQLKSKLYEEFTVDSEAYQKAKTEYEKSITDDQKERIQLARVAVRQAKDKKLHQKTIRNLGKPKRPSTAFQQWSHSLGLKRGTVPLGTWQKELIKKWHALPDSDKSSFEIKAAKEMTDYRSERKKWEEKMIELGNDDLVTYGNELNKKSKGTNKSPE